ncbi:hypothetical protein M569_09631, partial [Genlisea aurea]
FLILTILLLLRWGANTVEGGEIGVNWGRETSHKLIPSMVSDVLLQNGVRHIKIFSTEVRAMKALSGTGISLTGTMASASVPFIRAPGTTRYWLNDHTRVFRNMGINLTSIHIGASPLPADNATYYEDVVVAMKFLLDAITMNGHDYLVATTVHNVEILNPLTKPSEAEFNPFYKDKVAQFLATINGTKTPFSISLMPFQYLIDYNVDVEFAFMDNKSNFSIEDNGLIYRNAFELIYDSYLTALLKLGAPKDIEILISQIGWPTDAHPLATVSNAERFFRGLLPHIKNNKGTPLRPGASIDIYIYSLADENLLPIDNGGHDRHWGIYKSTGEPKFKMDLSGEGRDIYPTVARGTVSMPKRWCVFNGDKSNTTKVKEQFDLACEKADCTPLYPGGTCNHLTFEQNVSYAFNNYFQMGAQYSEEGSTCDFQGLGKVIPHDPSTGECEFQVEILAADLRDLGGLIKFAAS